MDLTPNDGSARPDLAVIIPAHNAAPELETQLEALVEQAWHGKWEVLVANNNSTDNTAALVTKYSDLYPNVRLVDASGPAGAGYARNVAMSASAARAFAFCDADDEVQPGWVAAMGEALDADPLVGGALLYDGLNPEWIQKAFYSSPPTGLETFEGIFPFAATCNLGARREVIEQAGDFDVDFITGQDVEFCLRAWLAGFQMTYAPEAVIQYRYRPSLSGLWKRSRQYGAVGPRISKLLVENGCERPSSLRGTRNWLWLLRHLGDLGNRSSRAHWVVVAGSKLGRIIGSFKERHLYL